jgi:hypothetical protein
MEAYLGGVLESLKVFYQVTPVAPAEKAAQEPPAAPLEESALAAPEKASSKPTATKTSKRSGKKKSSGA